MLVADIPGRSHAHAADEASGEIGENIAEHVFRHHDVEGLGPLHQVERRRIHVNGLGADAGELAGDLLKDAAEVGHRREHVGFVDQRHQFAPALGVPERHAKQPLGRVPGDAHGVAHLGRLRVVG